MTRHILVSTDFNGLHAKSYIDASAAVKDFCEAFHGSIDYDWYFKQFLKTGWLSFDGPSANLRLVTTEIY